MPTMGNETSADGSGAFFGTARADSFGRRLGNAFVFMTVVPAAWNSKQIVFIDRCREWREIVLGLEEDRRSGSVVGQDPIAPPAVAGT